MDIVHNYTDLNNAIPENKTVCQVSFTYKQDGEHHAGHIDCISKAKELADIVVVTYWPLWSFMNDIYGDELPILSGLSDIIDETYCTNFCKTNGVDIVMIPDGTTTSEFFDGYNMSSLKTWSDDIFSKNNYAINTTNKINAERSCKSIFISEKVKKDSQLWSRRDYIVNSWKDGYFRFITKDFIEDYTSTKYNFAQPSRRPDGLAYHVKLGEFTEAELSMSAQVKGKIEFIGWSLFKSNASSFISQLTSDINAIDKSEIFKVRSIDYYYNNDIIGVNNVLFEITLYIKNGICLNINEFYENI